MSAIIVEIDKKSPAAKAKIMAGEKLCAINGHSIRDVLDYKFYSYDASLEIELQKDGKHRTVTVNKPCGLELGLNFDTYLIDEQKSCANKCVFCFIDQLPKNLRPTLYFKDDDARLSFLMGNYISMTNLSDSDTDRIIAMRVSPLNISVHTTNPALREKMLGNPQGGASLRHLKRFADANIGIKAQIVLCPGLNDGDALVSTLSDLCAMYPAMQSISVVPVGLTKHREGLYPLTPMDEKSAREAITIINAQRASNIQTHGTAIVCAADEMFLKAHMDIPAAEYYNDYSQLENGVGLMACFEEELKSALSCEESTLQLEPFAVACGVAAAPFMGRMIDLIAARCHNLEYQLFPVRNDFFGEHVDVSGLVTGGDIISQLKGKLKCKRLLLPAVMLRHGETVFLDDVSISDVEHALGVTVQITEIDGGVFLDTLLA